MRAGGWRHAVPRRRGSSPLTAQLGIVRLLRGGETARVGGGQGRTVNVRLIAGAGPRLSDAVREGLFLKELHELLREYTITVPPLRERRSDIEALAARCASRFAQALGKQPKPIAPEAMEALLRYPWPGNVRELETVLERAVALAEGDVIGLSDLHARDLRGRGFRTHRKTAARPRSETPGSPRSNGRRAMSAKPPNSSASHAVAST